jgi:hypothetical protein
MIVNKKAEWLIPFVVCASSIIPKLKKLESLKLKKPTCGSYKPCHGSTEHDEWNDSYSILIHSHRTILKRKNPYELRYEYYSVIETLECLAHELGHLGHWDHTPEHKILESRIMMFFMTELLGQGYSSDEENMFLPEWLAEG